MPSWVRACLLTSPMSSTEPSAGSSTTVSGSRQSVTHYMETNSAAYSAVSGPFGDEYAR